ncbi:hypothetical protein HZI73_17965 [Vallitalea pronyensis]|uniref:Uncharacterized protein n=1 Tax=Vallitalea pronyensis TaxID=1348613 RepID=A0A8J8MMM9_9FIRM|nr:hypothetical protein [Vallitalea pronyensis]QUI24063.1 hypothetical protein HZI73_17965 [Vallitalea pronyensis]
MNEFTVTDIIDEEMTSSMKSTNKEDLKMKLINMGIHIGSYKINFSINKSYKAIKKKLEHYHEVNHAMKEKDDKLIECGMYNFFV